MSFSSITGIDEILADFDKAEKQLKKELQTIVKEQSKKVLVEARQRAPVSKSGSHGNPPGFLKKSLYNKTEKAKSPYKRVYGVGFGKDASYGVPVQYGQHKRNIPGNPFISDAYAAVDKEIAEQLAAKVADAYERNMKK